MSIFSLRFQKLRNLKISPLYSKFELDKMKTLEDNKKIFASLAYHKTTLKTDKLMQKENPSILK